MHCDEKVYWCGFSWHYDSKTSWISLERTTFAFYIKRMDRWKTCVQQYFWTWCHPKGLRLWGLESRASGRVQFGEGSTTCKSLAALKTRDSKITAMLGKGSRKNLGWGISLQYIPEEFHRGEGKWAVKWGHCRELSVVDRKALPCIAAWVPEKVVFWKADF